MAERRQAGTCPVCLQKPVPTVLGELPAALRDTYAGRTKVKDVRIERCEDSSGEPALFVFLVLSDPPNGAETWPVDDLWALRRMVREIVTDVAVPWFVVFESGGSL